MDKGLVGALTGWYHLHVDEVILAINMSVNECKHSIVD